MEINSSGIDEGNAGATNSHDVAIAQFVRGDLGVIQIRAVAGLKVADLKSDLAWFDYAVMSAGLAILDDQRVVISPANGDWFVSQLVPALALFGFDFNLRH